MNVDNYLEIRKFNVRSRLTEYLGLPFVPSVEMMLAAAERRNVFRSGDRLGDYIVAWEQEHADEPPALPDALVSQYGLQGAYELCVLADGWAGCLAGFLEWQRQRGREGSTSFVDSWLRAIPTECPPGGWPETPADCTDEHRLHARSSEAVSAAHHSQWWWELDPSAAFHGPSRCLGIMGLRGRQAESATSLFSSFDELVGQGPLPYVPGYTKEHYFDDEERSTLVLSAMWAAAVECFRSAEHHRPMPVNAQSNASRLVAQLSTWHGLRGGWSDFYREAPHRRIDIETDGGRFQASVSDAGVDWEIEVPATGSFTRRRSVDFRIRPEAELLSGLLRILDKQGGARFAAAKFE